MMLITAPGDAEHHQHHQCDHVGTDALEQEHRHREAAQPKHELQVVGQRQRGIHVGRGVLRRSSGAVVQQVPDAMAELLATGLEVGLRAPVRARHAATRAGTVDQAGGGVEHIPHLLGVVLPVGRAVQAATRAQLAHQQVGERRLQQAALVVALLVPRVREVDAHFIQRAVGDLVLQHFHRIVVVQAHVGGVVVGQRVQQPAHAGRMHLDADVITRRVVLGRAAQRGAVAEADFQHLVGGATEGGIQIARLAVVVDAETRPAFVERTLLGGRESALAQHEAAHFTAAFADGERLGRGLGAGAVERIGHQPISPSTGDEALA
ncbi:hypothetical protein G6F31_015606 [Rhizopus arrhizus]|nr:hypothetical protein G6F31_015606 [Rhizopus arrhizus]